MNDKSIPNLPALKAVAKPMSLVVESIDDVWRVANMVARSGMAPEGMKTPEALTIAMVKGMSLGMQPLDAVWSLAIINNRPTVPGDAALAVVRGKDLLEEFEEWIDGEGDKMTAHCKVKRRGEAKAYESTFSVEDAKVAGLWDDRKTLKRKAKWDGWSGGKQVKAGDWIEVENDAAWRRYPKRMLQYRARGFRFRDSFTDVLGGMHISQEFEGVTIDGEAVTTSDPPTPPTPPTPPKPPTPPPPPPPEAEVYSGVGEDAPIPDDADIVISEAAQAFKVDADAAMNEEQLDAAWTKHWRAVEGYGDQAFNRLAPIDDVARQRIQIEAA